MTTHCKICSNPLKGQQQKYCSQKCKGKDTNNKFQNYVAQQKRGLARKRILVTLLGGKCEICGYSKNFAALEFHHKKPKTKKFGIDLRHCSNNAMKVLLKEVKKCQLLCSNCHAEIEHPELKVESDALTD